MGLKVEPEQPALLAKAVEKIADNPALRDQMGKKGRALAEREFSWSFIVRDWVRQMERIAAGLDPDGCLDVPHSSMIDRVEEGGRGGVSRPPGSLVGAHLKPSETNLTSTAPSV